MKNISLSVLFLTLKMLSLKTAEFYARERQERPAIQLNRIKLPDISMPVSRDYSGVIYRKSYSRD
ncbi:hypothetical protein ACFL6G_09245 [candidate division KSB1 bacterium]